MGFAQEVHEVMRERPRRSTDHAAIRQTAAGGVLAKPVKGWAALTALGSADPGILVDLGHLPSPMLARQHEVAAL